MNNAIAVILNPGSGPEGARPDAQAVQAAFAAHGLAANVTVLSKELELHTVLDQMFAAHPDVVVAGGGDGTINAVAARVVADGHATLGVLPLGTLNHFAKDLGIPLDLAGAIKVIAEDHRAMVDVGQVNDRLFLNNASIGLYATIVVNREHERKRLHMGKWPALAKATWMALRDPDTFEAVVCVDDRELRRRTPFIFVGNNDYSIQGTTIGQRARLDDGALSIYVLRPKSVLGLLWLALRAPFGRVSDRRDLEAMSNTQMTVESRQACIKVARDGEVDTLDTPLRFQVKPRALRVFAPRGSTLMEAS